MEAGSEVIKGLIPTRSELGVQHPGFPIQKLAPQLMVGPLFLEPFLTPSSPNALSCPSLPGRAETEIHSFN